MEIVSKAKRLSEQQKSIESRIRSCILRYNYAASGAGTFTAQGRRKYMAREQEEYHHLLIQKGIIEHAIQSLK